MPVIVNHLLAESGHFRVSVRHLTIPGHFQVSDRRLASNGHFQVSEQQLVISGHFQARDRRMTISDHFQVNDQQLTTYSPFQAESRRLATSGHFQVSDHGDGRVHFSVASFHLNIPPAKSMGKSACYFNGKIFNGISHCRTKKSNFIQTMPKVSLFAIDGLVKYRADHIDTKMSQIGRVVMSPQLSQNGVLLSR